MMLHRHMNDSIEKVPIPVKDIVRVPLKKGEKAAVYVATRNMYKDMVTASKSLLCFSDVDRIYFLCEDDVFPIAIPKEIEPINVSGQQYFKPNSPNSGTHWTYMCLIRAVFDQMFPQHGIILSIDNDTAVVDDVSDLWDLDMTDYYYAGVPDTGIYRASGQPIYINGGIMVENLELQRANDIGKKMQEALNTRYYRYATQDTIDEFCAGHILEIPLRYNESPVTGKTNNPAIIHYAGINKFGYGMNAERAHYYRQYERLSWEEVKEIREKRYGKTLTI